jgi:hypothetical protein
MVVVIVGDITHEAATGHTDADVGIDAARIKDKVLAPVQEPAWSFSFQIALNAAV